MENEALPGAQVPAELPLLVFRAAGVSLAALTSQVEGIVGMEEASRGNMTVQPLAGLLGATASSCVSKVLLLKEQGWTAGVGIDSLEEVCTVRTSEIRQLPGLFLRSEQMRHFWGVLVRRNEVVLLLDLAVVKAGPQRQGEPPG